MVNNKPNDPYLNCSWHKDLTSFMKVENLLVEKIMIYQKIKLFSTIGVR
jgi:hypothetical protein